MSVSRTEVSFADVRDQVWMLGLYRGSNEIVVDGFDEGDILAVDCSAAVLSKIRAAYGQSYRVSDVRCAERFEVAVYGDMFHRGLRADMLEVYIYLPPTGPVPAATVRVSGMTFSRWPEPMREPLLDKGDRCPQCGVRGEFIRTALCCPQHGAFAGF